MEADTQRIQSCIGLAIDSVDRKDTLCQYSVASSEVVVINDTLLDERSSDNPMILEGESASMPVFRLLMMKDLRWEPSV